MNSLARSLPLDIDLNPTDIGENFYSKKKGLSEENLDIIKESKAAALSLDTKTEKSPFNFTHPPHITQNQLQRFHTLARWHGEVVELNGDGTFTAKIWNPDIADNPSIDEYIDFSSDEVKEIERKYIRQGAFFYWHIGHELTVSGQRKNTSLIIFRIMPVVGNIKKEAQEKARYLSDLIKNTARQ